MKNFIFFLSLFLISVQVSAQNGSVSISYVKEFEIKQDTDPTADSGKIFTIQDQARASRGVFRGPPGRGDSQKWMDIDLVYVMPGGLEPSPKIYNFSLDTPLKDSYQSGSFAFSGRADCLVYRSGMGWGTENNAGNFTPYLVRKDYQDEKEPSYEFIWQTPTNNLAAGSSIYLNYVFKIPKDNKTLWGTELSTSRFTFCGSFGANAPKVKSGKIILWRRGSIEFYSNDLSDPPENSDWTLPYEIKLTGFAVSSDRKSIYTATHEGVISSYNTGTSNSNWTAQGRAPLIVYGSYLFCMAQDYGSIQILDRKTGRYYGGIKMPHSLPRGENTFAIAGCDNRTYLFLQIPEQCKILTFSIRQ